MPASDISRLSINNGHPKVEEVAQMAKKAASWEVGEMIKRGVLNQNDLDGIRREYKACYAREYYKYFAIYEPQNRLIFASIENASAKKFLSFKHTVVKFSKSNYFIHAYGNKVTVGRINYPLEEDSSPETKEAFVSAWPGPLDRPDEYLRGKLINYINTLLANDSQRRIKYSTSGYDDQRKVILKLFNELLYRNGTIDAPGVTRLLLRPDQIEIARDEPHNKTLQKYLILGSRNEALKYARSRRLWDYALCLAVLDEYQPPNTFKLLRDGTKLKDESIIRTADEFISSIEDKLLNTVYRALMNRILQCDPESINIIKYPNVGSNEYEFAILSANDCEMEFDQSNEIFKVVNTVKQAMKNPHMTKANLVSLGLPSLIGDDPSDDLSCFSQPSYVQGDTHAARTVTISNIDMLILNEIWEYCLNLARGTCNDSNYDYLIDLVPYKLIFAAKLLDFGLYNMFAHYLASIRNALFSHKQLNRDPYYDWSTIEYVVEYLTHLWSVIQMNPDTKTHESFTPESPTHYGYDPPPPPPAPAATLHSTNPSNTLPQYEQRNDYPDSSYNNYPSLPYQLEGANQLEGHFIPSSFINQTIPEEVNDFNPESEPIPQAAHNNYNEDFSRRPSASHSMDGPMFSPPPQMAPQMTSSSPKGTESMPPMMGDSFTSPFSPINRELDQAKEVEGSRRTSFPQSSSGNEHQSGNSASGNKSQPLGEHQSGFFTNLVGTAKSLLPKSNSKQMILPDDSNKPIVYDSNKGTWVDTTKPEGEDASSLNDAPPMIGASEQPTYSFVAKTSKRRYPKV